MTQKRLVTLSLAIVLGTVGVIAATDYIQSFQSLTVSVGNGAQGTTTRITDDNGTNRSIEYNKPQRIKKGKYILITEGKDYQVSYDAVDLSQEAISITINPSFTTQRLASLLEVEEDQILSVLRRDVPKSRNYEVFRSKLYQTGQWYAAVLREELPESTARSTYRDQYRVVMEKIGGQWVVATETPDIVLTTTDYPDIPRDILFDVNQNAQPTNRPQ